MSSVITDILRPSVVTKIVSRIRVPGSVFSRWLAAEVGGPNIEKLPYPVRQYTYDIFDNSRNTAQFRAPGVEAGTFSPNPVGNNTVSIIRMAEKMPMDYNKIAAIRAIGENAGNIDIAGKRYVDKQAYYAKQRFANSRELICASLLRGGQIYMYQVGDDLLPSYTNAGALFGINFKIDAGNLLGWGYGGATITIGVAGSTINAITLVAGGSGYPTGTYNLAITGGGGTGGMVNVTAAGGVVTAANSITAGGTGYSATTAATTGPTYNNGLQMGTGNNIITGAWSNNATDIILQLQAMSAAYENIVGEPMADIWCNYTVWNNVIQNTLVRQFAGTAAEPVFEWVMTEESNSMMERPEGERPKKVGVQRARLKGMQWLTWHIYDGGVNVYNPATGLAPFTKVVPDNAIFTSIEPDFGAGGWCRGVEGQEIIKENDLAPAKPVQGMYNWIMEKADPARFDLHGVDNFTLELPIPTACVAALVQ